MDDKLLGVDVVQSAITLGVSATQLESVLGVVILVVQCCYILFRCIYSIYSSVKKKEYDKIGESIINLEEDLIKLLDDLKKKSADATSEEEKKDIEEKIEQVSKLIEDYGSKDNE